MSLEYASRGIFVWAGVDLTQRTRLRTTPEKFENRALFLRLGLTSTLIRHENGAVQELPSNRGNLKTPTLLFRMDRKHFESGMFGKRWRHDNHVISWPSFLQTQIQNGRRLLRLQIFRCSVDENVVAFSELKHRFQSFPAKCERGLKGVDYTSGHRHFGCYVNLQIKRECNIPWETGSAPQVLSVHLCAHLVPN